MKKRAFPPLHPGEMLLEDFLKPMGITQEALAEAISMPPRRIDEIVKRKRAITAETSLRLGRYFGMSDGFWLDLQAHYDLEVARDALQARLKREVKPRAF